MEELKNQLEKLNSELLDLVGKEDFENAKAKKTEITEIVKKINEAKNAEAEEKAEAEKRSLQKQKRKDGNNMETRSYKNAAEELMKGGVISTRAIQVNGENTKAVVPEQFINELEKLELGYGSLENECEVIPVSAPQGKRPVSVLGGKLSKLTPGQKIPEGSLDFKQLTYDVEAYGEIIAVDNALGEDSAVDLFSIIKENFAIKSVNTKNEAILTAIEANKKSNDVELTGDVVGAIIDVIDSYAPSVRRFVKVLANTALRSKIKNAFYSESGKDERVTVDANGRVFIDSHEVLEFDSTLANGTAQGYVLPTKSIKFFKRSGVEIAQSSEAFFDSNATAIRVVERFDVKGLDNEMVKATKLINHTVKKAK